jgi:hypothetical protein
MRKYLYVLVLLPIVGLAAGAFVARGGISSVARAETGSRPATTQSAWSAELVLPAGRKLVEVTWLCFGVCEPWTVTRAMRSGESAESYAFSNGRDTIVIRETAPSR